MYSSTKSFLDKIPLLAKNNLLLPRTLCYYFDDLFIADYGLDDSNGEPLAISNFNNDNTNFKLGRAYDNVSDFKFPLAKNQIFTLHDYENENYNKYIGIYEAESLSSNKIKSQDQYLMIRKNYSISIILPVLNEIRSLKKTIKIINKIKVKKRIYCSLFKKKLLYL